MECALCALPLQPRRRFKPEITGGDFPSLSPLSRPTSRAEQLLGLGNGEQTTRGGEPAAPASFCGACAPLTQTNTRINLLPGCRGSALHKRRRFGRGKQPRAPGAPRKTRGRSGESRGSLGKGEVGEAGEGAGVKSGSLFPAGWSCWLLPLEVEGGLWMRNLGPPQLQSCSKSRDAQGVFYP